MGCHTGSGEGTEDRRMEGMKGEAAAKIREFKESAQNFLAFIRDHLRDMPAFVHDPALLSISQLKSDLIAHNVALPPSKSRKQVYVELHLKHVERRKAEFSSDEEDQQQHEPEDGETVVDPSVLTDDDLKAALLAHGVTPGPIVASTRSVYENKLRRLLQPVGPRRVNGVEESERYSDSDEEESEAEEEEEEEEELDDDDDDDDPELGSSGRTPTEVEEQVPSRDQGGGYVYPQCFMPSSRLQPHASLKAREHAPKQNLGNALKSAAHSGSTLQGIKRTSSVEPQPGTGLVVSSRSASSAPASPPKFFSITEMVEEMETKTSLSSVASETPRANAPGHWSQSSRTEASYTAKKEQSVYYTPKFHHRQDLKEPSSPLIHLVPDLQTTPSGIYATRRRPIKGASKRPVLYDYPDTPLTPLTPLSPVTRARLEVERQVVPAHVLFVVFLLLTCLLYLIYTCVEDCSFSEFWAFIDSLKSWLENEPRRLLPSEMQATPVRLD